MSESRLTLKNAKKIVKQGLDQLPKEAIQRLQDKIEDEQHIALNPTVVGLKYGCPMYEALPEENDFNRRNEDDFWGLELELKRAWKALGYDIDTNIKPGKYDYVSCLASLSRADFEDVVRQLHTNKCRKTLECGWCGKMLKSKSGLTLHEKSCEFNPANE